jgi:hypothetical protein
MLLLLPYDIYTYLLLFLLNSDVLCILRLLCKESKKLSLLFKEKLPDHIFNSVRELQMTSYDHVVSMYLYLDFNIDNANEFPTNMKNLKLLYKKVHKPKPIHCVELPKDLDNIYIDVDIYSRNIKCKKQLIWLDCPQLRRINISAEYIHLTSKYDLDNSFILDNVKILKTYTREKSLIEIPKTVEHYITNGHSRNILKKLDDNIQTVTIYADMHLEHTDCSNCFPYKNWKRLPNNTWKEIITKFK